MRCRSPRPRPESGFTLTEVLIAMTILIVVLVLSMSLLFSMRTFAWRQQMFAEPRQRGRQAVDYCSGNLRTAGMQGPVSPRFAGIIIPYLWYSNNGNPNTATQRQTMWNNVDPAVDGPVADPGTDVICFHRPINDSGILISRWPGFQHAATMDASYSKGCPDDCTNLLMFLQESGALAYPHICTLLDSIGQSTVVQFDPWQESSPGDPCYPAPRNNSITSNCSQTNEEIKIMISPSSLYNPPGGHPELVPPVYIAAAETMTLRVKNNQLQQKLNPIVYDPGNPATADLGFIPLMDDVVDLQIVYYYRDGQTWNNTVASPMPTMFNGRNVAIPNVPDPTLADAFSASNVLGVGIHVVTRSPQPAPFGMARPVERPWVADNPRPNGYQRDRFFYQASFSNAMIRNRILGF